MIDLHCHMLPGVDDGSASEADSLEMGRIAARSGVTAIALTPHCNLPEGQGNYYDGALETRFRRLAMLFRQEGLPVTLYRGMEVFSTPELPRLLDEERLLTLGGGAGICWSSSPSARRRGLPRRRSKASPCAA